ncbi:hypothetical protein ACFVSN_30825 [Kitasatospora sp. NPDC057904]|uniref:hypothetical protein n=1 Tax=Kitasatospora sp. NPDC057904 TaxID=3346275 RepID=UPI0036DB13C2
MRRRPTLLDLIALVVILCTAVLLVCVGHVSAESVAVLAAPLAGLHAAWVGNGNKPDGKNPSNDEK